MKRFSILSLLPQSTETQVPTHLKFSKVLKLLRFFTLQTIKALEKFYIKNNYHEFDPHVGEASCQTRAYQILILASQIKAFERLEIQKKLLHLRTILSKIDNDITHYLKIDSAKRDRSELPKIIVNFVKDNGYYFNLNSTELFLTQSHILTIYKKQYLDEDPEIDYVKLCKDLEVSKNTARRLIHKYQILVSGVSCEFISNILEEIPEKLVNYESFCALKYMDDDGRQVLPCYLIIKVILSHIKWKNMPILLVVKREHNGKIIDHVLLPFFLSENGNYFLKNLNFEDASRHKRYYILKGITKYKDSKTETQQSFVKRILNVGLEKIILLNMAAHPQYSGRKLQCLNSNPFSFCHIKLENKLHFTLEDEFLFKKTQSDIFGCNANNSTLFYIQHVFCDTLDRQVNLLKNMPSKNIVEDERKLLLLPASLTFENHDLLANEASL